MAQEKVWIAVSFGIFVALAWRPVGKFIATALDKRRDQIQNELDEAMRLREEAQQLLVSFQRKQRDALKEAEDIIARAKQDADLMVKEAEQDLEAQLNKRIEMAMAKIEHAEQDVMRDVRERAVDMAIAGAETVLKEHLGKKESKALFDEALKDIEKHLH